MKDPAFFVSSCRLVVTSISLLLHSCLDGCNNFLGTTDDGQLREYLVGPEEDRRTATLISLLRPTTQKTTTNLGYRRREDNYFVQFADSLHELIDTRPFDDIDVMVLAFNLYWNGEICLVKNLLPVSCLVGNVLFKICLTLKLL